MNTPHRFLALAVVAPFVMSASGCVCVTSTNRPGSVTFLWTFRGQPCAVVPDVTQVAIQIPGQALQNAGVYGCLNGNPSTAGIVLRDFRPGTYSFTIQGNNSQGQTLYAGSGTFKVAGDVTVSVDLQPTLTAPGNALITWRLPQNTTCAAAVPEAGEGIATVDIIVDSATPSRQACNSGIVGSAGLQISGLTAGNHTIELRAYGTSGFQYFGVINSITINAGGTVAGEFQLQYVVGSLAINWQFAYNGAAFNCSQIGNPSVYVNLKDSSGAFVYSANGGSGIEVPCTNAGGLQGTYFPYLYGDTYQVYVQAVGTGGVLYRSNQASPPTAIVTAGQFPQLDSNTFAINVTYP